MIYNLNITRTYAPAFRSPWAQFREIYCNARDATNDTPEITFADEGRTAIFYTKTEAPLGHILTIGGGKASEDRSPHEVGQFNEGLKVVANGLLATGGSFSISCGSNYITYDYQRSSDDMPETLHATVTRSKKPTSGMFVTISHPSHDYRQYASYFLKDVENSIIPKEPSEYVKIFVKGVFICKMNRPSAIDVNLTNAPINRDRTMVDNLVIHELVADALWVAYKEKEWSPINPLLNPSIYSFEIDCLGTQWMVPADLREQLKKDLYEAYGPRDKVFLTSSPQADDYAQTKGYVVLRPLQTLKYIYVLAFSETSTLLKTTDFFSNNEVICPVVSEAYSALIQRMFRDRYFPSADYRVRLYKPTPSAQPGYDAASLTFWIPHRGGDKITREGISSLILLMSTLLPSIPTITGLMGATVHISSGLLLSYVYPLPTQERSYL